MYAYLAGFQYCALKSASVATPTSPCPAARASGAIDAEGIDVINGFIVSSAAWALIMAQTKAAIERIVFFICVILLFLFVFYVVPG
jgi:hypothetical protein